MSPDTVGAYIEALIRSPRFGGQVAGRHQFAGRSAR